MNTMQQWPSQSRRSARSYSTSRQPVPIISDEQVRNRYIPEHRSDALAVPAVALREWTTPQAIEVERVLVACSVTRHGDTLRRALVGNELREGALGALLDLQRGLGEGHSETGLQMPFDVACVRQSQGCEETWSARFKQGTYSGRARYPGCRR